jgi:hypothetical protein
MRTNYLLLFFFLPLLAFSQDGLEAIVVEKYYVSDAADNANKVMSGELKPGSVTYRIYVDMKPGFRFQAAFGSPSHPLKISSTQPFFNHSDAGTTHPNILPKVISIILSFR